MKKRILSLVLALSLCASLLVAPVSAASDFTLNDYLFFWRDTFSPDAGTEPNLGEFGDFLIDSESVWFGNYKSVSYSTLEELSFNLQYANPRVKFYISPISLTRPSSSTSSTESGYYGVRVLIPNAPAVYWLTDGHGRALVAMPEQAISSVIAIPRSQAASAGFYKMLSYEDLYNLAYDYNAQHNYKLALNTDGFYWAISSRGDYVLANESGLPYGAVGPSSITYGDNSRPDVDTGEDQLIDWTAGTAIDGNGDTFNYDGCIYDSSVKTYYIDNHTENYYYTYNYYIEKTYITYIGSSAEYTETYERYYELPDGRSSADLTKEDLEQLNLSMDVVPYIRSSDDTRLRSLYHFDGNTEDSSYWNYATSFDWISGASLTYLESNAFNGCLYLDELAHDFTITLPSSLFSGDFTVDFRYYQSNSGTPTNDTTFYIGGQRCITTTGAEFNYNGNIVATPVGTWNHIAFIRQDGVLKFYLNGVYQGSRPFSSILSSVIQFSFGSSQQTYKYFDELRVTNFAVWEENFTPPTVPYDTNLSLVLPTDTVPVADEYWDIQCESNLLSQYNLDWWDGRGDFGPYSTYLHNYGSTTNLTLYSNSFYPNFCLGAFPISVSSSYSASLSLSSSTSTSFGLSGRLNRNYPSVINGSGFDYYLPHGLSFCFNTYNTSTRQTTSYLSSGQYTFSMVSADGSIGTLTFNVNGSDVRTSKTITFNGYTICCGNFRLDSSIYGVCLRIYPTIENSNSLTGLQNSSSHGGEFVYFALERGAQSTVSAEFVSGVAGIPADDLNTPTLAVRSDIPITQKQIGGVRPTFAECGYVYAMVESGFITSLQQYTGYAWQAVDGRIWTGSRWIPYSSYNVITLSDMYDIADASGQSGYEYIYSETGFWSWWQKQWLEFKQWYTNVEFSVNNSFDYTNEKIKQTVNNVFMSIGEINTQIEEKIETTFNIDIDIGTGQSNSLGLLSFVQKVFGDLTSGLGGFTSTYLSPDDSLDVIFVPLPPPPPEEIE